MPLSVFMYDLLQLVIPYLPPCSRPFPRQSLDKAGMMHTASPRTFAARSGASSIPRAAFSLHRAKAVRRTCLKPRAEATPASEHPARDCPRCGKGKRGGQHSSLGGGPWSGALRGSGAIRRHARLSPHGGRPAAPNAPRRAAAARRRAVPGLRRTAALRTGPAAAPGAGAAGRAAGGPGPSRAMTGSAALPPPLRGRPARREAGGFPSAGGSPLPLLVLLSIWTFRSRGGGSNF